MNLRKIVLLISFAANVALALALFRQPQANSRQENEASVQSGDAGSGGRPGRNRGAPGGGDELSAQSEAAALSRFNWSQLESADYKEYIVRLRAFGVSERVIRDIIIADVQKLYRPRFAALRAPKQPKSDRFWENQSGWRGPNQGMKKEQRAQMLALQKEQKELIQELLGKNVYEEIAKDSGYPDFTERQFGSLSSEQRDKVTEMQQRYWDAYGEIHERAQGFMDEEMQTELKAAQKKMRDEVAGFLTPEQIKEYELRTSDIANNMRWQLSPFEPDEKEFRAIFDYKQAAEDLTPQRSFDPDAPKPSPEEMKARADKQKELEKAFADALGADRLKEYKMMDDWSLRNLFDAGVAKNSVFKVADMKTEAEKAARSIRNDKALTSEARNEKLKAIRAETQRALGELLGDRRANAYVGNGGWWLNNLAPREIKP